jgi:hypothetical protein
VSSATDATLTYRFYGLTGGRIIHAATADCANDDAARRHAARLFADTAWQDCDAIELWQGAQRVGTVRRDD